MARDLPKTVMDTTNLLDDDDDDQQLLDDDDDLNLEGEGTTKFEMRVKPRTEADSMRDELFGISRAPQKKEAVSSVSPPQRESGSREVSRDESTREVVEDRGDDEPQESTEQREEHPQESEQPSQTSDEVAQNDTEDPDPGPYDDGDDSNLDIN